MISLKKVEADDFSEFFSLITGLYAKESVEAGRWSAAEALDKSVAQTADILPDKEKTKDNYLYWVEAHGAKVGYAWYGTADSRTDEAFIFGVEIFEEHRGKGFGKELMAAIEADLVRLGFGSVGLHVYDFNKAALGLYLEGGYTFVGHHMKKGLPR